MHKHHVYWCMLLSVNDLAYAWRLHVLCLRALYIHHVHGVSVK